MVLEHGERKYIKRQNQWINYVEIIIAVIYIICGFGGSTRWILWDCRRTYRQWVNKQAERDASQKNRAINGKKHVVDTGWQIEQSSSFWVWLILPYKTKKVAR